MKGIPKDLVKRLNDGIVFAEQAHVDATASFRTVGPEGISIEHKMAMVQLLYLQLMAGSLVALATAHASDIIVAPAGSAPTERPVQ